MRRRMRLYKLFFSGWCGLSFMSLQAQLNAPLSALGWGRPLSQANVYSRGMGGLSNAVTDYGSNNLVNPATYGFLYNVPTRPIVFEGAFAYAQQQASNGLSDINSGHFNLAYLSFRAPLRKGMGLALAYQPQQLMAYKGANVGFLKNNLPFSGDQEVEGSMNRALLGIGGTYKDWSFGLNNYFVFGKRLVYNNADLEQLTGIAERERIQDDYKGWELRAGFLYAPLIKRAADKITSTYIKAGGYISYAPVLAQQRVQDKISGAAVSGGLERVRVLERSVQNTQVRGYPIRTGWGVVFEKQFNWQVGLDVDWDYWQALSYEGKHSEVVYTNTWMLKLGAMFLPDYKARALAKRIPLRIGGRVGRYPVLLSAGRPVLEVAATMGVSIPLRSDLYSNQSGLIHLSFEWLQRRAARLRLESGFYISVAFSVSDLWFLKNYYN